MKPTVTRGVTITGCSPSYFPQEEILWNEVKQSENFQKPLLKHKEK